MKTITGQNNLHWFQGLLHLVRQQVLKHVVGFQCFLHLVRQHRLRGSRRRTHTSAASAAQAEVAHESRSESLTVRANVRRIKRLAQRLRRDVMKYEAMGVMLCIAAVSINVPWVMAIQRIESDLAYSGA